MASPTPYKNYTYPAHGGAVGTWDTFLNTNFDTIDQNFGGVLTLYSSNGDVTLTSSQASNQAYVVTGALTANLTVTFTSSLGGNGTYVVDNQTTGAFSVSVTQTSTGATALTIPQGGTSVISGNGISFKSATSNQTAKLYSYLGSPQGNVAGTAATANGGATDVVRDVTNQIDYACKTTGSSSTALWVPSAGLPAVGGVLTVSTDANNPIPSGDVTGTTSVFWTPLDNNWEWLSDGTALFPAQFSRATLTLTNTNNAASQIQDVFRFWNSGTVVMGTGPTWAAGSGGSVTPGACARGTGAGGAALTRVAGAWVNAAAMTINNGGVSYSMGVGEGVYIGSVFIDASAGQTSCYRTGGQNRKWGVWSKFNRESVTLQVFDSTASWTYAAGLGWRASNGSTSNKATVFAGLAEEPATAVFRQIANTGAMRNGVGWNWSSGSPLGMQGFSDSGNNVERVASYVSTTFLGVVDVTCVENADSGTATILGGQTNMQMTVTWFA